MWLVHTVFVFLVMQDLLETHLSLCTPQGPEQLLQVLQVLQMLWLDQRLDVALTRQPDKLPAQVSHTFVKSVIFRKRSHLRPGFLPPWGDGKGLWL